MGMSIYDVLSYEDPLSYAQTPDEMHIYSDSSYVADWQENSLFSQLIDAWGEVKRAFDYQGDNSRLARQLERVRDICMVLYSEDESAISTGEKWEIKVAEWMLYDYLIGENRLHQSEKSALSWWFSMSHGINYALV